MEETVKDRLSTFLKSQGVSKSEFGRKIGVSSAYISSMRKSIQPDKLKAISESFPHLNTMWLLTGKGSMLRHTSNATEMGQVYSASQYDDVTEMVPFIPVSAHATFIETLENECSDEFERLPIIPCKGERQEIDKYKIFEVEGDSMFPTLRDGSLILAKEIPENRWHYAEGVVVAVFAEYVVVKRILRNNLLTGDTLLLGSDNEKYGQMTVALADIRALFKAKRIISSDII